MRVWDYFMRRKPLLLALLATIILSGSLMSFILSRLAPKATPIAQTTTLDADIEVPLTSTPVDSTPLVHVEIVKR